MKDLTMNIPALTASIALALGAKAWRSDEESAPRFYFNNLQSLYGLKCQYFNTGNICSATLDGEKISNSAARQIASELYVAKVWLDAADGLVHFKNIARSMARAIGTELRDRAVAATKAAPSKKFDSQTNRRAWAIRREAAARMGVALMSVSWGECLKMARAGE